MEGKVDLGYPAMHRPGGKLATFRSRVPRPNHYTTLCHYCKCYWYYYFYYQYFGDRAFGAAGPGLWNSLPSHLKDADRSYSEFRRSLKTFLFGQWGHGAVWSVLTAPTRNILTYLLTLLLLLLLQCYYSWFLLNLLIYLELLHFRLGLWKISKRDTFE